MKKYTQNIIPNTFSIKDALARLNSFTSQNNFTLFVINEDEKLVATITDGDIRRGVYRGIDLEESVDKIMHVKFRFLSQENFIYEDIKKARDSGVDLIPLLDTDGKISKIYNLASLKSLLPIDVVIMAGGRGERLKPLTNDTPKPLLKVGNKPIIEHNIDRLANFGVENIYITINYLGEQIIDYFGDGSKKSINIKYVKEPNKLGTLGSISLIDKFQFSHVLLMNSDLLTDINYENFYTYFLESEADMLIASIPYHVTLPYAVLDSVDNNIISFEEKPTYTYYSNAGIYLIKRELLNKYVKYNEYLDATDFMQLLLDNKHKVVHFPLLDYWLDIGKHKDYIQAQKDIQSIKL